MKVVDTNITRVPVAYSRVESPQRSQMSHSTNAKWAAKHDAIEREKAVARRERDDLVQQYMKDTADGNQKMEIQDYQFAVMKTNKAFFSKEFLEKEARQDESASPTHSQRSGAASENEEDRAAKVAARKAIKLQKQSTRVQQRDRRRAAVAVQKKATK